VDIGIGSLRSPMTDATLPNSGSFVRTCRPRRVSVGFPSDTDLNGIRLVF